MRRVNLALTSKYEEKLLNVLVKWIPGWVSPDMLTGIALIAALLGYISYLLAAKEMSYLWLVNGCLIIHWLADSLDGRIARYRNIGRPNYGYYVDHMLDSVSAVLFLGGLTTSAISESAAWIWMLALMLLLMTHTFLKTSTLKVFEMSMQGVGPTEARIGLFLVNLFIWVVGNPRYMILGMPFRLIDVIGGIAGIGLTLFLYVT